MKNSTLVPVRLGSRSYQIHIQPGLLRGCADQLRDSLSGSHIVVFTDSNVETLYLKTVLDQLKTLSGRLDSLVVPAGEASKSVQQSDALWQKLVEMNTDRKSVVVALGGGVVGDLAGFIAATYARGLDFIQIPTTLLAQVDSSVGGKVGINLPTAKNMVGAFWQPQTVLIDPQVLTTLDARNYPSGLAEVIKYGVIMDEPLFAFLEESVAELNARDPATLTRVIGWCCQCKATVVEEDETETSGRRAILNYGHTFGHAIEAVFGYGKFLHGEAIAIGMTCAARLAEQMGLVSRELRQRQTKLFQAVGLPTDCPTEYHEALVNAMKRDKKVSGGKLKLILPTGMGMVEQVDAPADDLIRQSLLNR